MRGWPPEDIDESLYDIKPRYCLSHDRFNVCRGKDAGPCLWTEDEAVLEAKFKELQDSR
jgi:hypothetical protein